MKTLKNNHIRHILLYVAVYQWGLDVGTYRLSLGNWYNYVSQLLH